MTNKSFSSFLHRSNLVMHAAPHPVWSSNIALHFFTAVVWVWQRTVRQTNHSADWASALRSLKPRSYHWAITELHVDYTSNGKNQPMCAILLGAMCLCIHCIADPSISENKIHNWSWLTSNNLLYRFVLDMLLGQIWYALLRHELVNRNICDLWKYPLILDMNWYLNVGFFFS